jgi:hypothetical protein
MLKNKVATVGIVARCPEFVFELTAATAISPDGAAVAMKLFQAAIVAVGATYDDWVVPDP